MRGSSKTGAAGGGDMEQRGKVLYYQVLLPAGMLCG